MILISLNLWSFKGRRHLAQSHVLLSVRQIHTWCFWYILSNKNTWNITSYLSGDNYKSGFIFRFVCKWSLPPWWGPYVENRWRYTGCETMGFISSVCNEAEGSQVCLDRTLELKSLKRHLLLWCSLKGMFDILGKKYLILFFWVWSIPLSCLHSKYEALVSSWLA